MDVRVARIDELAGHERARRFEGREHGSTISCFVSSNERGTGPSLHRHPYEEVFVVLRGSVTFTVEGEKLQVEAGHIVVVPAGASREVVGGGVEE